jgi:uncharacterized membrane protein YbhN (UPF0104 family)
MGSKKETKRFFLNMPWSVSVPFAAMIGVPFSIMAYKHPQQFADMVAGIAAAKWGGQFWAVVAIVLLVLLVGTIASMQATRKSNEEHLRRLKEELGRRKKELMKGEQE